MRTFLTPGVLLAALLVNPIARAEEARPAAAFQPAKDTLVYVGTYTGGRSASKGIYVFRLHSDAQNAVLVPMGVAVESSSPAFLDVDLKRRLVFAANENDGAVSSFAIEADTGKLKPLSQRSSMGAGPCHLVLDATGRNLLVANYSGGTVASFRVEADGKIGEPVSVIKHEGSSVNPSRQKEPHPHQVALAPSNRFAYVCDLGIDKVMIYAFDPATGKLAPAATPFAALKPGAGPRHLAFRPDGKFAYVINELNSTVTAFAVDAQTGKLTEIDTQSSLPANFNGRSSGAEIAVLPNGKSLFASNRGHNSLAQFAIDAAKGTLTLVAHQDIGGKTPRHFGVQPNAEHLVIGNQDTNQAVVCRIDPQSGRLTASGVLSEVPSPVCIVFVPPGGEVK